MLDFCSENRETITVTNYNATYSGTSCLPNNGTGFASGQVSTDTGLVDSSALSSHLATLLNQNNANAPGAETDTTDSAKAYATKAATLRSNIMTEYCFYYKRYIFILHEILMTAATSGASSLSNDYVTKKTNTIKLNSKLNQILQILQALVNSRTNSLKGYYGPDVGVNKLNAELDATRNDLIQNATLLQKASMEKDTKAAMVDYSIEKNSSSRNLLAIYGFMNIVAAGLLFYVYRSANKA